MSAPLAARSIATSASLAVREIYRRARSISGRSTRWRAFPATVHALVEALAKCRNATRFAATLLSVPSSLSRRKYSTALTS